jgi:hypothetical protein
VRKKLWQRGKLRLNEYKSKRSDGRENDSRDKWELPVTKKEGSQTKTRIRDYRKMDEKRKGSKKRETGRQREREI